VDASSLKGRNFPSSELKVAFVGDSGHEGSFTQVLRRIKDEKADLVLHLGDLGYDELNPKAPKQWDDRVSEVLGESFPYLFLIGNHDVRHWNQEGHLSYSKILKKRLANNPDVVCIGEEGIKSYCTFRGLFFVLSGVGTYGTGHEEHIAHALKEAQDYSWRVCAWHKNQRDMQTGGKTDEVGWAAYQLCQDHGAMIATGHEHSYARTKNLRHVGNRKKRHGAFGEPDALELAKGKTFAFVSGLGGASLRPFHCRHKSHKWWASIFANNFLMENGVVKFNECDKNNSKEKVSSGGPTHYNYGALFVKFNHNGDPRLADAEFKTVDGRVIDKFTIHTSL
jgi:hypothetical protein